MKITETQLRELIRENTVPPQTAYEVEFFTGNGAAQDVLLISASRLSELYAEIERKEDELSARLKRRHDDPESWPDEWIVSGAVLSVDGDRNKAISINNFLDGLG